MARLTWLLVITALISGCAAGTTSMPDTKNEPARAAGATTQTAAGPATRVIRDGERTCRRYFTAACQSAMSRAGPVSSRMCMPVLARSTM